MNRRSIVRSLTTLEQALWRFDIHYLQHRSINDLRPWIAELGWFVSDHELELVRTAVLRKKKHFYVVSSPQQRYKERFKPCIKHSQSAETLRKPPIF